MPSPPSSHIGQRFTHSFGLVLDHGFHATRESRCLVLETMVDTKDDLSSLLLVLDPLEFSTRPHPSLNPHVFVLSRRPGLPLLVAFLCHVGDLPSPGPAHACKRPPAHGYAPPPSPWKAQWAPRVALLVRPSLASRSVGHMIRTLTDPLLVLTSTPCVHAL